VPASAASAPRRRLARGGLVERWVFERRFLVERRVFLGRKLLGWLVERRLLLGQLVGRTDVRPLRSGL
jgi:hypothetical protein